MGPTHPRRRPRTVTLPLGVVAGVVLAVAAVASAGRVTGHEQVLLALLVASTASHWLPVGWTEVDDATHVVSTGGLWMSAAAVLLPLPLVVLLGGLTQLAGWVLTCTLGNGVHRPPFDWDAGIVNTAMGALGGLAAALVAAPFTGTIVPAALAGLAFMTTGLLIVATLEGYIGGSSMVRLWVRSLREAAPALALGIVGAVVVVVCVAEFGPWAPAAVATGLVVLLWRQAAALHHHRSVTAALLGLATSATSARTVEDVEELVAEAGRGILGRDVGLARDGQHQRATRSVVATEPVGTSGWVLQVGQGTLGRPFGEGPRERRALTGLAAAADVALLAARSHEEIRNQAIHDELSGLLNRRGFQDAAGRLLERSRRDDRVTTVAYIDLDGFKQVNDRLGHEAGDDVIAAVGSALRRHLRPVDVVGRVGGDEFAVLFGEQLDEPVADRRIAAALSDLPHGVTGSVGIARGTGDLATLVTRADEQMYAAKRRGRSRGHEPADQR